MRELKELTDELYNRIKANPKSYDNFSDNVDRLHWGDISYSYKLSEDVMREFRDYLLWKFMSEYQDMSFEFIIENIEDIVIIKDRTIYSLTNNPCFKKLTEPQQETILNIKQMHKD